MKQVQEMRRTSRSPQALPPEKHTVPPCVTPPQTQNQQNKLH